MSFTNHTPNYNLPQYVGTDKPTFLGDFNNAMTTIDTQMHNNAQKAGEGIAALQQAQAELSQTQETLKEVQTEVANVSGIAANVNTNVQQALSAANDATTAANNATSQIQPAVTAANKASADAQAAQQVANGNVTTLNQLSERVTALEEAGVKGEITKLLDSSDIIQPNGTSEIPLGSYTDYKALFIVSLSSNNYNSTTPSGATFTHVEKTMGVHVWVDGKLGNGSFFTHIWTAVDITESAKITVTRNGTETFQIYILGVK